MIKPQVMALSIVVAVSALFFQRCTHRPIHRSAVDGSKPVSILSLVYVKAGDFGQSDTVYFSFSNPSADTVSIQAVNTVLFGCAHPMGETGNFGGFAVPYTTLVATNLQRVGASRGIAGLVLPGTSAHFGLMIQSSDIKALSDIEVCFKGVKDVDLEQTMLLDAGKFYIEVNSRSPADSTAQVTHSDTVSVFHIATPADMQHQGIRTPLPE
jgi:hypothetical protein